MANKNADSYQQNEKLDLSVLSKDELMKLLDLKPLFGNEEYNQTPNMLKENDLNGEHNDESIHLFLHASEVLEPNELLKFDNDFLESISDAEFSETESTSVGINTLIKSLCDSASEVYCMNTEDLDIEHFNVSSDEEVLEELTKFGKGKDSDDDQSELQVVDNTLDWLNKTYEEGLSNYTNFGNDLNESLGEFTSSVEDRTVSSYMDLPNINLLFGDDDEMDEFS